MAYLRVKCYICGEVWNFFAEKWEQYPTHTAVDCQGCVCPNCGNLGWIESSAGNSANVAGEPLIKEVR